MSTRRSRSSRSRKSRPSEAARQDAALAALALDPVAPRLVDAPEPVDPSNTAQLRALEAGWDELLA